MGWYEALVWWGVFALCIGGKRWTFPQPAREIAWLLQGGDERVGAEMTHFSRGE